MVLGVQVRGFAQQLSGMAHGTHRIANLVGDAGAQAAQGREFQLLRFLGNQTHVLQEHQYRCGLGVAQGCEVRPQHPRAVGADQGLDGGIHPIGALTPGFQQVEQSWGRLAQQCPWKGLPGAQQARCGFVDQANPVLDIHHQDAFAQVLDDVVGQLLKVGEVDFLAPHQGFALAQAVGDRPHRQADHEQHDAQHAHGGEIGRRRVADQIGRDLLRQQSQRRDGGHQEGILGPAEQGHRTHREHQEDAQATARAAGGVQNEGDGQGVDRGVHQGQDAQAGPRHPARQNQQYPRHQVAVACDLEQFEFLGARQDAGTGKSLQDQQHRRQQQPIKIGQPDDPPGQVAGCRRRVRDGARHQPRS